MCTMSIKNNNLVFILIDKVLLLGNFSDTIVDIIESYRGFSVVVFIKKGEFI